MENVNSTQRRKLLALHKGEVNTLIAARHAELGWIAHDDGYGAVLQLGARSEHQKRCLRIDSLRIVLRSATGSRTFRFS